MGLTLEELFDLAEAISSSIGLTFMVKKESDKGWRVYFVGISKRDNLFIVETEPHKTIKEALLAALKAVKPINCTAGAK